jgi:hypothetical protein
MATIDLSRSATEFVKHYTSVRAQMGRVFTDDDHNDNERLHGEEERRSLVDIIGPAGSPDDGFLIKNPTVIGGKIDFEISPGTFYLGGNRLVLENIEQFQTQRDWVNMSASDRPAPPVGAPRFDLVYLECWHQPVSAVEDSELFEVALGGPDTSERMRLMRRVRVFPGAATGDCHKDWATLIGMWTAAGLGTVNEHNELVVDTTLTVGFEAGADPNDLCSPPVAGGYLGAENQAIRVQLVDQAHFTWGFDNAAPLYRINIGPNNVNQVRKITMITEPKDQAHWPVAGQIVEILPWSAELANGEKLAEGHGFLARIDTPYDPDTHELFISADVPAGFGEDWLSRPDETQLKPEFFYMRVWNRGTDTTSLPAIPFVNNGAAVKLGNTGLNVAFHGNAYHPADFWIIAARPQSPNRVVPWLLESGRGPHGIRRYYAVLGVIQWTTEADGKVTHDCREKFPPLTRLRGCCTYTVGDGTNSFGAYSSIQAAINSLPPEGGEICLLPGLYKENVSIIKQHDIRIHGCGVRSVLQDNGHAQSAVITILDSQRIEINNLEIQTPVVTGIQVTSTPAGEPNKNGIHAIDLDDLTIVARDASAIDCQGGEFIRIRRNVIEAQELLAPIGTTPAGESPLVYVRADDVLIEDNRIVASAARRLILATGGVQIGGGSERVEVRRNHIDGGNGNGITLGSLVWVSENPNPVGGGGGFTRVGTIGFVVDANGCLKPNPHPQAPKDPNNNPMKPQSEGDLYDIRILDNDILDMGTCGISTLRFFEPAFGPVNVRGLDVEQNRIRHCVQLELGDNPFGPGTPVGFGGVTLVAVEDFELRGNRIEENGNSYIDPICGVYVGLARGFVAESNIIAENGPRIATAKQPTTGPRGGIVIEMALTPLFEMGGEMARDAERTGSPAARIGDNIVTAPHGRALALKARGSVMVEGNVFTSRGVETGGSCRAPQC